MADNKGTQGGASGARDDNHQQSQRDDNRPAQSGDDKSKSGTGSSQQGGMPKPGSSDKSK